MKFNPWEKIPYYYEDPCYLCAGLGRIAIEEKKRKTIPTSEICPMCKGKGFLKIQKGDLNFDS